MNQHTISHHQNHLTLSRMNDTKSLYSLGEIYRWAVDDLINAGIPTPHLDARILLSESLGIGAETILTQNHTLVHEDTLDSIHAMISRRTQREPVSRILGRRSFWTIDLLLTSAVFDPRSDSEVLISTSLDYPHPLEYVLDLGTGSGCLLLSVLKERPEARGLGIDIVPDAITVAALNADRLEVTTAHFVACNWTDAISQTYDMILCNPPYIKEHEITYLDPEVGKYDPLIALYGGQDGLDAYRILAPRIAKHLNHQGWAIIEIGDEMKEPVSDIFIEIGLDIKQSVHDLTGKERCLVVVHPH